MAKSITLKDPVENLGAKWVERMWAAMTQLTPPG